MAGFSLADMFSFEKSLAPRLMKLVYFLGLIGLVIFGVVTLFGALAAIRVSFVAGLGTLVLAVLAPTLGALLWRVIVELWMLGFNIYDRLGEIRDRQAGFQPHGMHS